MADYQSREEERECNTHGFIFTFKEVFGAMGKRFSSKEKKSKIIIFGTTKQEFILRKH